MIPRIKDDAVRKPITVDKTELMQLLGVGRWTAEKIAEEAGASIKIGKRRLYSVSKIEDYISRLADTEKGETL